ncbi:MAG TPA: hypothetical protein VL551_28290 [Actinospica sp.]|nr:hypothetical protein [Actinospica sp.]
MTTVDWSVLGVIAIGGLFSFLRYLLAELTDFARACIRSYRELRAELVDGRGGREDPPSAPAEEPEP